MFLLHYSLRECQCAPWNFPQPMEQGFPLCTFYGNSCFKSKMANLTYKTTSCSCLPSCNSIKYDFNIDLTRKITDEEIEDMCIWGRPHSRYIAEIEEGKFDLLKIVNMTNHFTDHVREKCRSYLRHEYAHVTIRIDGTTYLKRVKSLKYTETDKLSIVGGTLGLFSGFSFIVIFELLYWVVTISKMLFK